MSDIFFLGPHHPIFETIVKYPPSGYRMISDVSEYSGEVIKEYGDVTYLSIKNVINKSYRLLRFPRVILIPHEQLFDAVFTINALPQTSKPCIIGVETVYHLLGGERSYYPFTASILIKFLRRCRVIVAISNASKESIINYVCLFKPDLRKELSEKIEVVYPAIDTSYINPLLSHKSQDEIFWLVHVNTRPLLRGLKEFLEASIILGGKYDIGLRIKLTPRFVTEEVLEILKRYVSKFNNFGVKIYLKMENLSRKDLFEQFYLCGDLFILPTWMDSFGYVFLEAMSASLPCIGSDLWAIPEIINNDELLVHLTHKPYLSSPGLRYLTTESYLKKYYSLINNMHPKIVKELSEKIEQLINNPIRLRSLGNNFHMETSEGKFSVKQQQSKLKDIYERVLKR